MITLAPDMKGSHKYVERGVADSQQKVVSSLWDGRGLQSLAVYFLHFKEVTLRINQQYITVPRHTAQLLDNLTN
jgi:hypothetical protein